MKHIWSPWRMKYMRSNNSPDGCIFCDAAAKEDGIENLIVTRSQHAFVILNRYPYTSGHVMVVPYAHAGAMGELDKETLADVMSLIQQAIAAINKVYKPEGFNIGANLGAVAGAGIANHIHFHVVPRWAGDTNFMTSVGEARVIPEDLDDTLQHLKNAWPA
jgi:ATP adenylyltransferase